MKLTLDVNDIKPQYRHLMAAQITIEHLTEAAQIAVSAMSAYQGDAHPQLFPSIVLELVSDTQVISSPEASLVRLEVNQDFDTPVDDGDLNDWIGSIDRRVKPIVVEAVEMSKNLIARDYFLVKKVSN